MIPIWVLQLSRQGHRVDCWDVPRATEKPWLAACLWVFLCLSGIYPILEKLNLISPCITKQCGPFPKFERKHKRKQQFGRPFVVNIDLCIFSEFITLGGNTLIENHSYWNTNLTSFYPESTNLRLFRLVFMTVQWCSMFNLIFNVTDIDITRNILEYLGLGSALTFARSQGPSSHLLGPVLLPLLVLLAPGDRLRLNLVRSLPLNPLVFQVPKPWNIMDQLDIACGSMWNLHQLASRDFLGRLQHTYL